MQLKKLELFGFKSFADRTKFDFEPGVTIIVGPNGCGKSNVVDSMKWILGEQSAKSLRGTEMLDVVFNGSRTRKPLGFAEASLTFANTRGVIHPDLDEICVTRRLHRDGQSEYMINRKSCRLKDIRELFMDTGVGLRAYSIIEQGKIDSFLQASPIDRRLVFEEAAGISKYKARKKEALRKLERVAHNLEMISINITELDKQLRSLKVQAGRARSYREAAERLRKLRIALSLHEYHGANEECLRISGDLVMVSNNLSDVKAAISVNEAEVAQVDENLKERDGMIMEKSGRLSGLENSFSLSNERIRANKMTIESLREEEIRLQERIAECESRIAEAGAEQESLKSKRTSIEERSAAIARQIELLEAELARLASGIATAQAGIQDGRSEIMQINADRARVGNDVEKLRTRFAEIDRRRASLESEHEGQSKQRDRAQVRCEMLGEEIKAHEEKFEALKTEVAAMERREADLAGELARKKAAVAELDETRLRLTSRVEVLEGYRDRMEGVSEGARQAIEEARRGNPALSGIRKLLVDELRVDEKFARAIEEALGGDNADVLAGDFAACRAAVDFLRESRKGRGTFIPAAPAAELPDDGLVPAGYPGVLGRAVDFVEAAPDLKAVLTRRLGWTLVVENLDVAVGLKDMLKGYDFVTLDGEVLRSDGTLTGGAATMGRISHAAEIARLRSKLETVASEFAVQKDLLEKLGLEMAGISGRIQDARHQCYDVGTQLANAKDNLAESEKALAEFKGRIAVIEGDLAGLDAEAEMNRKESADLEKLLADLRCSEDAVKARLAGLDAEIQGLSTGQEKKKTELHALNSDGIRARMEIENIIANLHRIGKDIAERRQNLEDMAGDMHSKEGRRAELCAENADLDGKMSGLSREIADAKQEMEFLRKIRDDLEQEKSLKASQLKEKKVDEERLASTVNSLRIDEERLKMLRENIVKRAAEDLEVDVKDLSSEFDDGREDWEGIQAEAADLRQKIKNLGTINEAAIEEFEAVNQRFGYLSVQRDDLLSAREQISSIIKQIDKKSRVMFAETFETIKENFKVIFKQLFNGGRADIILADENDILESEIDIVAQPGDKKPQSITLLSGGEKVMTCIALLFAIFKSKPSPFCILDEVDAALDERNIDRFVNMLGDFLKGSQFIIISHNKRTMMVGDRIFGITMQEAGVSKKVSLQIEEAGKIADDIARGVKPEIKMEPEPEEQPAEPSAETAPEPGPAPDSAAEPAQEAAAVRE